MRATGTAVNTGNACVLSGENRWRQVLQKTGVIELLEIEAYIIGKSGIEQMRIV
jgi:hypothetical protein